MVDCDNGTDFSVIIYANRVWRLRRVSGGNVLFDAMASATDCLTISQYGGKALVKAWTEVEQVGCFKCNRQGWYLCPSCQGQYEDQIRVADQEPDDSMSGYRTVITHHPCPQCTVSHDKHYWAPGKQKCLLCDGLGFVYIETACAEYRWREEERGKTNLLEGERQGEYRVAADEISDKVIVRIADVEGDFCELKRNGVTQSVQSGQIRRL